MIKKLRRVQLISSQTRLRSNGKNNATMMKQQTKETGPYEV